MTIQQLMSPICILQGSQVPTGYCGLFGTNVAWLWLLYSRPALSPIKTKPQYHQDLRCANCNIW